MGNTLPEPRTEKHSEEGTLGTHGYTYGLADMQGWRLTMEDAYVVADDLATSSASSEEICFVGVFDGHGGSEVAKFCAAKYISKLKELENFKKKEFGDAMKQCYHLIDEMLQKEENFPEVVNYRADAIIQKFNLIAEIIINNRANSFTLSQLQEVLNQANFFNVTLTIQQDLLSSLEKLYESNDRQKEEQAARAKGEKPSKPSPPKKPQKPGAPASNTKSGKKGFFGSRIRRGKNKTQRSNPSKSKSEAADDNADSVDTLSKAEDQAEEQSKKPQAFFLEMDPKEETKQAPSAPPGMLPTNSARSKGKDDKSSGPKSARSTGKDDGSKAPPPNLRSNPSDFNAKPPGLSQLSLNSVDDSAEAKDEQEGDDHDPFAAENELDEELEGKVSVQELEIEEEETKPDISNIRSSMQINRSKSAIATKDDSGSFEGLQLDEIERSAGLSDSGNKRNKHLSKRKIKHRTKVKRHRSKRGGLKEESDSDEEPEKKSLAAAVADVEKANKVLQPGTKPPKPDESKGATQPTVENAPENTQPESTRKKSKSFYEQAAKKYKTLGEEEKPSEDIKATEETKVEKKQKETSAESPKEKKKGSGKKPKTMRKKQAESEETSDTPNLRTGLNMEPYAVQKKNSPNENPDDLPKFITAAGCTAISALFYKSNLYIANIGDSRAVLSRNGHAIALSTDHKPSLKGEEERIVAAGGTVNAQGRINGDLNLSRCVGDLRFKTQKNLPPEQQIVSADADITKHEIRKVDQFLVLACDGVWDVMNNQQVVHFILKQIHEGETSVKKIAENLLDKCLSPNLQETRGLGGDNMTCIIVLLQPMDVLQAFRPEPSGTVTNIFRRMVSSTKQRKPKV